jgi:hypothetical protein
MKFEDLKGKILSRITLIKDDPDNDDSVIFEVMGTKVRYKLFHDQDCCEQVNLEEVIGDFDDLIGTPILLAEEVVNFDHDPKNGDDSYTWSFYKLSTIKGSVTLRWYGTSNGYYSEEVDFVEI